MVKRIRKMKKSTPMKGGKIKEVPAKKTIKTTRKLIRKRKPSATEERKSQTAAKPSTSITPFLYDFNRDIFKDPFFTDPWEDLFSFPSFDKVIQRARDFARRAFRSTITPPSHSHSEMDIDTKVPGTYQSKSYYRNISQVGGKNQKGEIVSHENMTHIDEHGKKFTEKKKTYENLGEKVKKTTHTKMIGNRGIKDLKTHYLNTGKEYQHSVLKNMIEKDLQHFNDEFDRSVKPKWRDIIGSSEDLLKGSPRKLSIASADTDWMGEEKERFWREKGIESPRERGVREGETRRSLRSGEERKSKGKRLSIL